MPVEQGLSFTVVEAPHPFDDRDRISSYNARRDFYSIRRVWLGWVPGTDWLHNEIERHFGEDNVWYDVRSSRDATHVGAAGEVSTVLLILMGIPAIEFARRFVGTLGERSADDIYDWVRNLVTERRRAKGIDDWADGAPDFTRGWDIDELAERMKQELASIMGIPAARLALGEVEKRESLAFFAVLRDVETGVEYTAEVGKDDVLFKHLGSTESRSAS